MSFCQRCKSHATFTHTVFRGTTPTTIKLCDSCAEAVGVRDRLADIKSAPDHDAKTAAVDALLSALDGPGDQAQP